MRRLRHYALHAVRNVLQWGVNLMFRIQCGLRDLAPGFRAAWVRRVVFFCLYDIVLPLKLVLCSALERVVAAQGRVRGAK
jgi:hypothetical protein